MAGANDPTQQTPPPAPVVPRPPVNPTPAAPPPAAPPVVEAQPQPTVDSSSTNSPVVAEQPSSPTSETTTALAPTAFVDDPQIPNGKKVHSSKDPIEGYEPFFCLQSGGRANHRDLFDLDRVFYAEPEFEGAPTCPVCARQGSSIPLADPSKLPPHLQAVAERLTKAEAAT